MPKDSLTKEQANAIYDILVDKAGAYEGDRPGFVYHESNEYCSEYRFMGSLGFGGKFWRNVGLRSDGTYGEVWYVNVYPEDLARWPEKRIVMDIANLALEKLRLSYEV